MHWCVILCTMIEYILHVRCGASLPHNRQLGAVRFFRPLSSRLKEITERLEPPRLRSHVLAPWIFLNLLKRTATKPCKRTSSRSPTTGLVVCTTAGDPEPVAFLLSRSLELTEHADKLLREFAHRTAQTRKQLAQQPSAWKGAALVPPAACSSVLLCILSLRSALFCIAQLRDSLDQRVC